MLDHLQEKEGRVLVEPLDLTAIKNIGLDIRNRNCCQCWDVSGCPVCRDVVIQRVVLFELVDDRVELRRLRKLTLWQRVFNWEKK